MLEVDTQRQQQQEADQARADEVFSGAEGRTQQQGTAGWKTTPTLTNRAIHSTIQYNLCFHKVRFS